MSAARTAILNDIARGLGRAPLDPAAQAAVTRRIDSRTRNTVPLRGQLPAAEQRDLFVSQAQAMGATVNRIGSTETIPDAIADYLAGHNLPTELILSPDPDLTGLPWQRRPLLSIKHGAPWPTDMVGVALAVAGVAETGTLVLHSGAHASTSLNFTPDTHIVVVHGSQVVGAYEDAFDMLRAKVGPSWPRTVNLITGPSRTADIEQTLIMGAHGPRRLHVILVENQTA